jgi:hypothetical protein
VPVSLAVEGRQDRNFIMYEDGRDVPHHVHLVHMGKQDVSHSGYNVPRLCGPSVSFTSLCDRCVIESSLCAMYQVRLLM